MVKYYVNVQAQRNGDHEVHVEDCVWMPAQPHQRYLGEFNSCEGAVAEAANFFSKVNGCIFCCNSCHTQ